jgi:hypothetical protein
VGDVIRFPLERRNVPPLPAPPGDLTPEQWVGNVTMSGAAFPFECTDVVHNFDSVPGHCRCGERYWDPDDPEAS